MKIMNHIEYLKKLKKKSTGELLFIIQDCKEAMKAMPDNENNGYYQNEICYCASEINRRRK